MCVRLCESVSALRSHRTHSVFLTLVHGGRREEGWREDGSVVWCGVCVCHELQSTIVVFPNSSDPSRR